MHMRAAPTLRSLAVSVGLLLAIGLGVPFLERWIKCRDVGSEACVWAKAYLPLSIAVWSAVGLMAAVVAWFVLRSSRL